MKGTLNMICIACTWSTSNLIVSTNHQTVPSSTSATSWPKNLWAAPKQRNLAGMDAITRIIRTGRMVIIAIHATTSSQYFINWPLCIYLPPENSISTSIRRRISKSKCSRIVENFTKCSVRVPQEGLDLVSSMLASLEKHMTQGYSLPCYLT